jgi:hypothetical protein
VLVADPDRVEYRRLGVGRSRRALLHRRAIRRLVAEARAGNRAQKPTAGSTAYQPTFL